MKMHQYKNWIEDDRFKDYYDIPAEVWDENKCKRMTKHVERDGMGTPYSFKGACPQVKDCPQKYNGGVIHNNKWYQGEIYHLPILAVGYAWTYVSTWCWRIIKINS